MGLGRLDMYYARWISRPGTSGSFDFVLMLKNITKPYEGQSEYPVKNIVNLFQTGLKEMVSARNIMTAARRLLRVSEKDTQVILIGEHADMLKMVFSEKNINIFWLYYIPKTHRIDFYDHEGLIAAFEKKKCISSRCTDGLQRLGFEDIFKPLVTLT